jgi:UDP-N-acetyl-D-mannosaminuronic acid dehydrogenase
VSVEEEGTQRAGLAAVPKPLQLVVIGGCGHVGLPLALSFAEARCSVGIYDIDAAKVDSVRRGEMPFRERGADELLARLLPTGRLELSSEPSIMARAETLVLVIGTPIDEFMNPSTRVFERVIDELGPYVNDGTLLILRSTVYPGTTEYVADRLQKRGHHVEVAFCPERVAEGHAIEEIRSLPQLIGASSDQAFDRACELFAHLDVEVVRISPKEAEIAKLLTNTWRYMKFAIANQFFQMAHSAGVNYDRVLHAVRGNYPRASDLPSPGFAAGPCLLKDTMQLAAFTTDHFPMGHAAMLINEGLPGYVVDAVDRRWGLRGRKVGLLGMAFKGDSDDPRTSLSYKLRKLLSFRGAQVLATDPYVPDLNLSPLEDVLRDADLLIIGAPHSIYRSLDLDGRDVIDIWNITGKGIRL